MNNSAIFRSLPAWQKVTLYFLIILIAAIAGSRITALDSIFFYFAVALIMSYLLLKAEGRKLSELGSVPVTARDYKHLVAGSLIGIAALSLSAYVTIQLNGGRLIFNNHVSPVSLLILIVIHLWSAFAQEFTYRGYPFQRLLQSYGPWVAQIGVTLPFAVMHLKLNEPFTTEQFLMMWLTTGIGSILYGLCYIKRAGWRLPSAFILAGTSRRHSFPAPFNYHCPEVKLVDSGCYRLCLV
jgi:membrane protease YdiL (CAAX protease family)